MVRISIPNLPSRPIQPLSGLSLLSLKEQAAHLRQFLEDGDGRTLVITGAGVSVESGIRAYRGKAGSYSNPNYKPIFYGELVEDTPRGELFRKRYWARSFLGYPPVRDAEPNPTHIAIAAFQSLGLAPNLITQNVDNLHRKALHRVSGALDRPKGSILELHGTLARVHCLAHWHEQSRDDWQEQLANLNPAWDAEAKDMAATGRMPRTNPDGDVELPGADYTTFSVPECHDCVSIGEESIVKPNVIFFGETLPKRVKEKSFDMVDSASRVLVMGTTLATYSAFRLIKAAREAKKPVLMITQGPTRADDVPGVEKMDVKAGPIVRATLESILSDRPEGTNGTLRKVLDSGVVKALPAELPSNQS